METTREAIKEVAGTTGSGNAGADRMAVEASRRVRAIVQQIVDELSESHVGRHPDQVVEAVQLRWSATVGTGAAPLPEDKAAEYATHISRGNNMTIVPAEGTDLIVLSRSAADAPLDQRSLAFAGSR